MIAAPANRNYCATVVAVKTLVPLPKCDNLLGIPLFGAQAIVGKDTKVGDIGVVFPAETQLDDQFCRLNNLYRHSDKNADQGAVGYLEDNRRVRAIKLRGNRSDALFLPLECLAYTGFDLSTLNEGDEFDTLGDAEICRKFTRPRQAHSGVENTRDRRREKRKKEPRVDIESFPEHRDTVNFFKVCENLDPSTHVTITQKLHGTSIRIGRPLVRRRLPWYERVLALLGVAVQRTEYDYVYGSRRVIRDTNDPNNKLKGGYYGTDLYAEEGEKIKHLIPNGFVIYGELIGWVGPEAPIQKHYTYDCLPGTRSLYIYRVSYLNDQGFEVDLSWDAVKDFCKSTGLRHVPELSRGSLGSGAIQFLLGSIGLQDKKRMRFFEYGLPGVVPLCDGSPCDEGVVIRVEGIKSQHFKLKFPEFLQFETKSIDKGDVDTEEANNGTES